MVLMIIKGVFRKYERWNPVHPTYGTFWGMGIGIGCGVGWGPGFGPEVIGYVGSGCGIGFSIGITFAGVGIGLPANFVIEAPYNATRSIASVFVRSSGLLYVRNVALDGWDRNIGPHISSFCREANARFSNLIPIDSLSKQVDMTKMKSIIKFQSKPVLERLRTFGSRHQSS